MSSLSHSLNHTDIREPAQWPNRLLWTLCGIPVLHIYLLNLINLETSQALLIQLLRPVGTLGAAGMLSYAAWLERGHRRWAWGCHAAALCSAAAFSFFKITQDATIAMPPMRALWMLLYFFSFAGTALYLQHHTWWIGSTWRIIVGGLSVGSAALVLMQALLPRLVPAWSWTAEASIVTPSLAFDIGIIFAFSVVGARHKHTSSPLILYVVLCLITLLIADSFFFILSWAPWGRSLQFILMPLYTLHSVLLAFAAYRDVTYTATEPTSQPSAMPLTEWLLWVLVPLVVMVIAFTAASILGTASPALIVGLAVVTIAHEVLAMFDYRRVTLALQKARLDAADLATAQERNRLARDIHDGLGHYFTGIGAQLNAAQLLLDTQRERALTALGKAQHLASTGLDDVRRSIAALREQPLGTRSLPQALTALVEDTSAASRQPALLVRGTPRPLAPDTEITLYRAVQEGLTNARKHAQAQTIQVLLDYRAAQQVTVTIRDDGQGAAETTGGFGLSGMRERLALLGGTMQVITAPGQGLTITVEVPG